MQVLSSSPNLYYSNNKKRQATPAFTGSTSFLTSNKAFKAIESKVADGCVWLVSTDAAKKLVTSTNNHEKLAEKLTSHLIVLGSTILSGFYIGKTLKNKNMEESKRKTLAVNQALVYGTSTVMAYSFDGWARKGFNKIFTKIEQANKDIDSATMKKLKSGFGIARTIIIVDTVYRFIAPVIVTPIANYIGNKLKENKQK